METMRPTFTPCMVLLRSSVTSTLEPETVMASPKCMVVIFFKAEIDELVQPFS